MRDKLTDSTSAQNLDKRATTNLNTTLKSYKLPGLAALTVRSNGSVETVAVGVRKIDDNAKLTTKDIFHLGSNTKSMTATLLAKIIETGDGSLTWNTTVPQALPLIRDIHSGFTNVTLAMLALHRSGISLDVPAKDLRFHLSLFNSSLDPSDGRAGVTRLFLRQQPDYPPNTAFKYSNVNYIILGSIIDNLGTAWETRIQRDLWQPLGMNECGLGAVPQSSSAAVDNPYGHSSTSQGYLPISPLSTDPPADNPPTYGPAATAHCSMSSYAKFLALHLSASLDQDQNPSYLSSQMLRYLQQPPVLLADEEDSRAFTPGWVSEPRSQAYNGTGIVSSGSNTLNWVTAAVVPGRSIAVAALTNGGDDKAMKACDEVVMSILSGGLIIGSGDTGNNTGSLPSAANSIRGNFSQALASVFLLGVASLFYILLGI